MAESLKELLARVEALTGPDREVDAEIAVALDCYTEVAVRPNEGWVWRNGQPGRMAKAPEYSASLDAAVALVEERLPGWEWTVAARNRANVFPVSPLRPMVPSPSKGATPVLSLLVALLRAELSRSDQGGGNA